MKKLLLTFALFMITASTFAKDWHFTSSCGRACTYTTPSTGAALTQELKELNGDLCGTTNVTIIYY